MCKTQIDQIIRTKRKTFAIIIQSDGRLVVRAPLRATNRQIIAFVDQHAGWIQQKQAEVSSRNMKSQAKNFRDGEKFLFLGKEYPLILVDNQKQPLLLDGSFKLAARVQPKAQLAFTGWYKKQAAEIIFARVDSYVNQHGFSFTKFGITGARTRWGSCSQKGSLNFSWRLVMAPMEIIDYIVVHELVHTRHHNHSRDFWSAVAQIMPQYRQRRSWLKENGYLLTRD